MTFSTLSTSGFHAATSSAIFACMRLRHSEIGTDCAFGMFP